MDGSKSVITIKEYGKISIHLKEIMDSKGITRNYLARDLTYSILGPTQEEHRCCQENGLGY